MRAMAALDVALSLVILSLVVVFYLVPLLLIWLALAAHRNACALWLAAGSVRKISARRVKRNGPGPS